MNKVYERINWENEPSISTPLSANNLNKIDYSLNEVDNRVIALDVSKANQSDLLLDIKSVAYNPTTGVWTFTHQNGTTDTFDQNIEKIPVTFSMDENGVITMTTADGTTFTCDVGTLIKTYTFVNSGNIQFTVTTDEQGNKSVTANVIDGSITRSKLDPDYLAQIDLSVASASASATAAGNSATAASGSATTASNKALDSEAYAIGTRGGVPVTSDDPAYENNSKYYAEHGASSLIGLTDTDISNPTDKQALVYDEANDKWVNADIESGSLENLEDVSITNPEEGDVITYNSETEKWENKQGVIGNISDDSPYLTRETNNGNRVGSKRVVKDLVGGSVVANQLVDKTQPTATQFGVTFTNNDDGSWTLTGTPDRDNCFYNFSDYTTSNILNPNHVYFVGHGSNKDGIGIALVGQNTTGFDALNIVKIDRIIKLPNYTVASNSHTWARIQISNYGNTDIGTVKIIPQVFDLTSMFGTTVADALYSMEQATAGSGVALFRQLFPNDYYAYQTGSLVSVKPSAMVNTGFNQWDEQWEVGSFNDTTGVKEAGYSNTIRSKNFIPVIPNTSYKNIAIDTTNLVMYIFYYDYNKNFISKENKYCNVVTTPFTTPSNAYYVMFYLQASYGTTYNHDICINISDPTKNGTYEPYDAKTYPISEVDLRGLLSLSNDKWVYNGDIRTCGGEITRKYGIVDLGSLTWKTGATSTSGQPRMISSDISSLIKKPSSVSTLFGGICAKYDIVSNNATFYNTKGIALSESSGNLFVYDADYTDATTFKTAMDGVYLIYELATPTTEYVPAFSEIQDATENGTESFTDARTFPMPVAHHTDYPYGNVVEDFMQQIEVLNDKIEDAKKYEGYTEEDIYGVEVDMTTSTFTRIGASVGLKAGTDFDNIEPWKRRRCTVADNGTVNHYYGETGYAEDGSDGQVMVEQPKFYYRVVPLLTEKRVGEKGVHLRKARYYVSGTKKMGFKVHPAFVRNGVEMDYIYLSAYEGSTYDVSASAYNTTDAQTVDFTASTGDKLSSIAGAKPTSGSSQSGATRDGFRKLGANRGTGWTQATIQSISATQLLFLIEYAQFNMQSAIGAGITNKSSGSGNEAENTGYTSSLGNATGQTNTSSTSYKAVSYRGEENPYGNIWKWIDGINVYNYVEGSVWIADHTFADSSKTGAYQDAKITVANANGYVSAFAYSEDYDWLFIASEVSGGSALPVGDYFYQNKASNQYTVAGLGGTWSTGSRAGGFCLTVDSALSRRTRDIGGRLLYAPASAV